MVLAPPRPPLPSRMLNVLYCEPPAATPSTAIGAPRPSILQAREAGLGLKIRLIKVVLIEHITEIKLLPGESPLVRTDTTLDLSQKAEKV